MAASSVAFTTNIFNIFAASCAGPVPVNEVRSRLSLELLFADTLYVAPAVFLCNPATSALRENCPDFLKRILADRQVVPLFHSNMKTFADLYPRLVETGSPSLDMSPLDVVQKNIQFLDDCLADTENPRLAGADVLKAKTDVSKLFVGSLGDIVPELRPHQAKLRALMDQEVDTCGAVEGRWWYRLATAGDPAFRELGPELGEVGAIVHDLSYSRVSKTGLTGHNYARTVRQVAVCSQTLMPVCEMDIRPDLFESSDVRPLIFNRDILLELEGDKLLALREATVTKRREFLDSMQLVATGNAVPNDLRRVKVALDEYLCELANELESELLERHKANTKKKLMAQSVLTLLKIGNNVVPLLAGVIGHVETTRPYMEGRPMWWIVPTVLTGMGISKYLVGVGCKKTQEWLNLLEARCVKSRPVDIKINR